MLSLSAHSLRYAPIKDGQRLLLSSGGILSEVSFESYFSLLLRSYVNNVQRSVSNLIRIRSCKLVSVESFRKSSINLKFINKIEKL